MATDKVDKLHGLLVHILDTEANFGAALLGGPYVSQNMATARRNLGEAIEWARKNGHDDVAESLEDLRPVFEEDLKRACIALRELRISVRLELDGATQAAGLPRTPPASVFVPHQQPARSSPRVGRNDPCPCGSGKKHKKCCGRE